MHRVALIYNPASGRRHARRAAIIADVAAVFRAAGIDVALIATESQESVAPQTQQAISDGCDTIVACGGDGTIHDVLQAMVGGSTALGIIPMGTANALAADLGLPSSSPVAAAKMLLAATPTRIPVGRVTYRNSADSNGIDGTPGSRYFIVAAGIGVDAFFFSQLDPHMKRRFGYTHYFIEVLRLWARHHFPLFAASFTEATSPTPRTVEASQILAVRVGNFGGLIRNLVPGAALGNSTLHVIAFKTRNRLRYFRFMAAVWFRRHTYSGPIELIECTTVECRDLADATAPMFVEADGELLGILPARIEVVPNSLTLLIPAK